MIDNVALAVVSVADQYMIMMAVTILFTILALVAHDNIAITGIAGLSWVISALAHFAVGDQTSALTIGLSGLYVGFGLIFIVWTLFNATKMLGEKRTKDRFTL